MTSSSNPSAIEHQTRVVDVMGQPQILEIRDIQTPDPSGWIVMAWYHGGWWKVFNKIFITREAAERKAMSLPSCYWRRIIVNLGTPGA